MLKAMSKKKVRLIIVIFCLIAILPITSSVFASDDRTTSAPSNDSAFAGAILAGLLGAGGGTAVGSPLGYFGMGALIGAEAGAFGGALIGAGQKSNQQRSEFSQWTVSEEALIFNRVGTDKWVLVERVAPDTHFLSVPTTPSTPAFNSSDFNQGWAPGLRVNTDYQINSTDDLLLSFFYIGTWDSSKSVGPDDPLNWLEMKAPGSFFQTQDFPYQSMTWDYSTQLYNVELNAQKKVSDRVTALAGFRWLQLRENLQGTIPPADIFKPDWKLINPDLNYVAGITSGTPAPAYPPFWNPTTPTARFVTTNTKPAQRRIYKRNSPPRGSCGSSSIPSIPTTPAIARPNRPGRKSPTRKSLRQPGLMTAPARLVISTT